MRWRGALAAWSATIGLWQLVCSGAPALAQEESERAVAVVIDADLDDIALRAALARMLDQPVTTLSRAQAEPGGPTAVLTISVDVEAGVSVMYWEQAHGVEWLSAPLPAAGHLQIELAARLAVALVQQHRRERQAQLALEANPYLRPLPKARPPRPAISPVNPYYRPRHGG